MTHGDPVTASPSTKNTAVVSTMTTTSERAEVPSIPPSTSSIETLPSSSLSPLCTPLHDTRFLTTSMDSLPPKSSSAAPCTSGDGTSPRKEGGQASTLASPSSLSSVQDRPLLGEHGCGIGHSAPTWTQPFPCHGSVRGGVEDDHDPHNEVELYLRLGIGGGSDALFSSELLDERLRVSSTIPDGGTSTAYISGGRSMVERGGLQWEQRKRDKSVFATSLFPMQQEEEEGQREGCECGIAPPLVKGAAQEMPCASYFKVESKLFSSSLSATDARHPPLPLSFSSVPFTMHFEPIYKEPAARTSFSSSHRVSSANGEGSAAKGSTRSTTHPGALPSTRTSEKELVGYFLFLSTAYRVIRHETEGKRRVMPSSGEGNAAHHAHLHKKENKGEADEKEEEDDEVEEEAKKHKKSTTLVRWSPTAPCGALTTLDAQKEGQPERVGTSFAVSSSMLSSSSPFSPLSCGDAGDPQRSGGGGGVALGGGGLPLPPLRPGIQHRGGLVRRAVRGATTTTNNPSGVLSSLLPSPSPTVASTAAAPPLHSFSNSTSLLSLGEMKTDDTRREAAPSVQKEIAEQKRDRADETQNDGPRSQQEQEEDNRSPTAEKDDASMAWRSSCASSCTSMTEASTSHPLSLMTRGPHAPSHAPLSHTLRCSTSVSLLSSFPNDGQEGCATTGEKKRKKKKKEVKKEEEPSSVWVEEPVERLHRLVVTIGLRLPACGVYFRYFCAHPEVFLPLFRRVLEFARQAIPRLFWCLKYQQLSETVPFVLHSSPLTTTSTPPSSEEKEKERLLLPKREGELGRMPGGQGPPQHGVAVPHSLSTAPPVSCSSTEVPRNTTRVAPPLPKKPVGRVRRYDRQFLMAKESLEKWDVTTTMWEEAKGYIQHVCGNLFPLSILPPPPSKTGGEPSSVVEGRDLDVEKRREEDNGNRLQEGGLTRRKEEKEGTTTPSQTAGRREGRDSVVEDETLLHLQQYDVLLELWASDAELLTTVITGLIERVEERRRRSDPKKNAAMNREEGGHDRLQQMSMNEERLEEAKKEEVPCFVSFFQEQHERMREQRKREEEMADLRCRRISHQEGEKVTLSTSPSSSVTPFWVSSCTVPSLSSTPCTVNSLPTLFHSSSFASGVSFGHGNTLPDAIAALLFSSSTCTTTESTFLSTGDGVSRLGPTAVSSLAPSGLSNTCGHSCASTVLPTPMTSPTPGQESTFSLPSAAPPSSPGEQDHHVFRGSPSPTTPPPLLTRRSDPSGDAIRMTRGAALSAPRGLSYSLELPPPRLRSPRSGYEGIPGTTFPFTPTTTSSVMATPFPRVAPPRRSSGFWPSPPAARYPRVLLFTPSPIVARRWWTVIVSVLEESEELAGHGASFFGDTSIEECLGRRLTHEFPQKAWRGRRSGWCAGTLCRACQRQAFEKDMGYLNHSGISRFAAPALLLPLFPSSCGGGEPATSSGGGDGGSPMSMPQDGGASPCGTQGGPCVLAPHQGKGVGKEAGKWRDGSVFVQWIPREYAEDVVKSMISSFTDETAFLVISPEKRRCVCLPMQRRLEHELKQHIYLSSLPLVTFSALRETGNADVTSGNDVATTCHRQEATVPSNHQRLDSRSSQSSAHLERIAPSTSSENAMTTTATSPPSFRKLFSCKVVHPHEVTPSATIQQVLKEVMPLLEWERSSYVACGSQSSQEEEDHKSTTILPPNAAGEAVSGTREKTKKEWLGKERQDAAGTKEQGSLDASCGTALPPSPSLWMSYEGSTMTNLSCTNEKKGVPTDHDRKHYGSALSHGVCGTVPSFASLFFPLLRRHRAYEALQAELALGEEWCEKIGNLPKDIHEEREADTVETSPPPQIKEVSYPNEDKVAGIKKNGIEKEVTSPLSTLSPSPRHPSPFPFSPPSLKEAGAKRRNPTIKTQTDKVIFSTSSEHPERLCTSLDSVSTMRCRRTQCSTSSSSLSLLSSGSFGVGLWKRFASGFLLSSTLRGEPRPQRRSSGRGRASPGSHS